MKRIAGFNKAAALVPCSVLLSMSVGCGSVGDSTSEQKVYGGTKVSAGGWPTVVAITQKSGGMFCTGTAITPTVVITAAHCAKGFKAANVSVYVGEGKEGGRVSGQYQAKAIKYSPKYSTDNDIAYITLTTPLDLDETDFIPVLTTKEEKAELLAIGTYGHIVGFGNRDDGGFGLKYEVDGKITKLSTTEITLGGSGKDSCNGDSGGPVFGKLKSGEWRVYGVTSRGGACGTGGIYGLMHANICWIQEDSGVDLGLPEGTCDSSI